ncbi:2-oxoglutarate dehydrogenase, E2 component, dihydrolipoamide succinyltransferase [Bogoriella caseilytica]|uniref:Dihydrolipoamide acetyltransferase component of pyruvate dehydrogenase complex n=1 Tax=Bogoriella caseilytica TaxID=56055 RepID=A0A3N2B974_9MICO|nr:2-oxoglutarate dehydrogenase, E2 component, dihydrolipoamide succinyltransferase [Bogoriella caseilytica]ROR71801.1 2-oxoglutarate dehydrogenase E2 component [Bogoriella caseilytica]
MSESVKMPALGESVTEGTVTRWLKSVGDTIEVDEPLLEVSTDKVDTEVPSPVAGTLEKILVDEDETVEVGAELAVVGDGSGGGESGSGEESGSAEAEPEEPAAEEAEPEAAVDGGENDQETEAASASGDAESTGDGSGSEDASGEAVTMPALGESVTEGTITRWLKAEGDTVEVDEPLLEVSTDKVDTEVPSPVAGTVVKLLAEEDETVEVGAELAIIGSGNAASASSPEKPAEEAQPAKDEKPAPEKKPEPEPEPEDDAPAVQPGTTAPATDKAEKAESGETPARAEESGGRTAAASASYVTPLVRKLAHSKGVDLSTLEGTGVGGRIRKQDVEAAAQAAEEAKSAPKASAPSAPAEPAKAVEPSPLRGTQEKAPRIRQVIARRMKESLEVSAQLTQVQEVDMTRIVQLRAKAKDGFAKQNGAKLTYLPFLAKAVTEALKQHPKLNAEYNEESQQITYHEKEHLSFAVDTEKGLMVPVIDDAGSLNLAGLAQKIADVAERTRTNKIKPDELSGGTFTITNIGSVGALFDTPIINQPQVAILGTGTIEKRPAVVTDADGNDTIGIRHLMYLSLTYDHRLVDGADAGRFLQTVKARLEEGAFASELGL